MIYNYYMLYIFYEGITSPLLKGTITLVIPSLWITSHKFGEDGREKEILTEGKKG